jgi:hypothetical protein
MFKTITRVTVLAGAVLALGACSNPREASKANFTRAIQAYLDGQNGLCVPLPANEVPFTLPDQDLFPQNKARADALVQAGLLAAQPTEMKPGFGSGTRPATEYRATTLGQTFLDTQAPKTLIQRAAFCSGTYRVQDVTNFTEPGELMGVKLSHVEYTYTVKDGADWTRSEALGTAYPELAKHSQDRVAAKATLILTHDGWVHESQFKR